MAVTNPSQQNPDTDHNGHSLLLGAGGGNVNGFGGTALADRGQQVAARDHTPTLLATATTHGFWLLKF